MSDKVRSVLYQASYEAQALNEEASRLKFPEGVDIAELIQQQLNDAYALIPDIKERNPAVIKYLLVALNAHNEGDEETTKRWFHRAQVSFKDTLRDKWTEGVQKQHGTNAKKRAKVIREERQPEWDAWQRKADEIVADMRAKNPSKKPSLREVAEKIANSPEGGGKTADTIRKRISIRG